MSLIWKIHNRCENSIDELFEIAQELEQENTRLKSLLKQYLKIESTIPTTDFKSAKVVAELTKDVLKELRR